MIYYIYINISDLYPTENLYNLTNEKDEHLQLHQMIQCEIYKVN